MKIKNMYKPLLSNPALGLSVLVIVGLYFAGGSTDVLALKTGAESIFSSNKVIRVITVSIAGLGAFILLNIRQGASIAVLTRGNLLFLTMLGIWAVFTVFFSPMKSMTLFKGAEILTACMIAGLIVCSFNRSAKINGFIIGIFWVYVFSTFSALLELAIVGTAGNKELVGVTPLLSTMMQSRYPPMVGNGLGFLGALTSLFGLYLFDGLSKRKVVKKLLAVVIIFGGSTVLFLSYTRSILVFFIVAVLFYSILEKRFGRVFLLVGVIVGMLIVGSVREAMTDHMRRGATDQQIVSLSGRLAFWGQIFSQDTIRLISGGGFATGTLFQNYENLNKKVFAYGNAHNSIAELVGNAGLIGAFLWLLIVIRIPFQLIRARRRCSGETRRSLLHFNSFISSVFLLSVSRSLMNSTFVYLDYFYFIFLGLIVYGQINGSRASH